MAYSSDLNTRLVQYTDHGPLFSVQIVHYSEQEQPNFNVVYVGSTGLDLNFGLLSSVFKSIGAPKFRRKKSLVFECWWYLVVQSNAPVKGLELFSIFYKWALKSSGLIDSPHTNHQRCSSFWHAPPHQPNHTRSWH